MAERYDNNAEKMRRDVDEILNRVDQLPELDNRSPEEIIGYDENGLPSS
jgi:antitoxin VapB